MKYILSLLALCLMLACGNEAAKEDSKPTAPNTPIVSSQPKTAIDSINLLIANDQYNAKLLAIRANLYLAAYNTEAARNDINVANTIDTNVAELRQARGEMAYMHNNGPGAKKEWEACIKLEPNNKECLSRLIELYIAILNYDRALELANKLIEVDPDNAQAYFMKGIIIRDKHQDTTLALQYFQNAVDLKQDYVDALDMLGVLLAAKGDTLAKFYYMRILDQHPNRDDIYYKLGVYYMDRGEVNRAFEAYDKAIQINPRNSNAYYSLGYMYINLQDYTKAKELFTKSINTSELNYRAYYGRAYCYEILGDIINARKDYIQVLDILPMHDPAKEGLARISKG